MIVRGRMVQKERFRPLLFGPQLLGDRALPVAQPLFFETRVDAGAQQEPVERLGR